MTTRLLYSQFPNSEIFESVLHYDMVSLPASFANAASMANAIDAYMSAGVAPLLNVGFQYIGTSCFLDDGALQTVAVAGTPTQGTSGGSPLPQQICAIIRKFCNSRGRRRFGHTCHPGIDDAMTSNMNTLSVGQVGALTGFYAGLNNAPVLTGIVGSNHIIYHADIDTRDAVYAYQASGPLRTNRHRTLGRGI